MEPIIDSLMAEPLYVVIAVLIAGCIIYAIMKKVIKLALFLLIIFGAYLGYLGMNGREIPLDGDGIKDAVLQDVEKAGEKIKKKSSSAIQSIKKEAGEKIKKEAKEMINNEVDQKLSAPKEAAETPEKKEDAQN